MTADPRTLSLAKRLIKQRGMRFTPAQYRGDDYAESLYRLIRAKAKGEEFTVEQHAGTEKVSGLMDALLRILQQTSLNRPVKAAK